MKLSNEEFLFIARELEIYHGIFAKLWNVGKPEFTDKIPTAAVTFNKEGHYVSFLFNPTFWQSISEYERLFVISHECLHVILNHGYRLQTLNKELGNVAADVVINEMLVSAFGFDRTKLDWVSKEGCWLNTVFKDNKEVLPNESMEYYYNLLKKDCIEQIKQALASGKLKLVDSHDEFESFDDPGMQDIMDGVMESMTDDEKENLTKTFKEVNPNELKEGGKQAGTMAGELAIVVKVGKVQKKKKWETVIKNWSMRYLIDKDKVHEQWARLNRRFTIMDRSFFLPSEMEIEEKDNEKRRIKVAFFLDTSGSCAHLGERFFKAAKSLPDDRFDIDLYCFDTRVYKTSLATGKLYGFGGTSFDIIEDEIQSVYGKDAHQYPKAVFIITDGYGNQVNPLFPKRWYWFLSDNYRGCIPSQSKVFMLENFE